MFERFTAKARHVVVLAQEEARALSHNYIGTEHILLGLIREGNGVAAQVLSRHVNLQRVRPAVLDLLPASSVLESAQRRRWLRPRLLFSERERPGGLGGLTDSGEHGEEAGLSATPAPGPTPNAAAKPAS